MLRIIAPDHTIFVVAVWSNKERESAAVEHWTAIAGKLSQAGFRWACSSEVDSTGRVISTADA